MTLIKALLVGWLLWVAMNSRLYAQDSEDLGRAIQLVKDHCVECHGASEAEGGLDLSGFSSRDDIVGRRQVWDKIRARVHLGEMPPVKAEPLAIDDRQWFPGWVAQVFRDQARTLGLQCGPSPLRRLNRNQYGNTIRDLLRVHFEAGHELPSDGAGGEGFDNSAETLFLSPIHGEKYLSSAKEALEYAARDSKARELIFVARPLQDVSPEQAAAECLKEFSSRAFRRPVTPEQLDRFIQIFKKAFDGGLSFDDAVLYTLQAVLISPHFLFLIEPANESDAPKLIDDYSLASRLSYFLWDSMPDEKLRKAAGEGGLNNEEALAVSVDRMLKHERLHEMSQSFIGQWLGTRQLGRQIKPDPELYPKMIDEVADAYREEPVKLFEYILRENRSLLELIQCDYSFMNQDLLRAYNVDRKSIKEDVNQNLKRLPLPDGSVRGGLATMAGPLTVSSYPNRTSPVLRGKWLMEALLGEPPPAPPPDVPTLSEKESDKSGKSLRQRLQIHRENIACASCHERLDPLGFSLENFDPIGRWRDEENGVAVDAEGLLASGQKIAGSAGLKQYLLQRKEPFIRNLTTKLLGYALGRGLVDSDFAVVDAICDDLAENEYQAIRLIIGIVRSAPFRYRHDTIVDSN